MNGVRLLVLLEQKAGGWEALAEAVDLTVWDTAHKKIIKTAEDVYKEIREEYEKQEQQYPAEMNQNSRVEQRPAPARAMGRRAIISNGLQQGRTLDEVQAQLAAAGLPALYPRVGNEAAVEYLLLLNKKLRMMLPQKERRPLYNDWLRKLQGIAAQNAEQQLDGASKDAQAPQQKAALAELRGNIRQARCTYQHLVNYVDAVFEKSNGAYQTIMVTGTVISRLTKAVQEADKELHAGMPPATIWACLEKHWRKFLDRVGSDLVKNQLNAQNYLARALVRGLDSLFDWLAEITAGLYPNLPLADARWQLHDILTEDTYPFEQNDLFYLPSVLAALFSQDRGLTAEDTLPEDLVETDNWKELPATLKPFFFFFEAGVDVSADRDERVKVAKTNWAAQPMYLSGVARLLLGLLDYGDEQGFDSAPHQTKMAQLYADSGGYLAKVLCGEADLDRNVFLLFLLLTEDICARRLPRHEQISARLGLNTRDEEYTNLLGNCGFPLLNSSAPFDAALWAALDADLPATQRKDLFVKALLICEQAEADFTTIPPALGLESLDCSGKSAALTQAFEQLFKGRHVGAYTGRN